jgi:hypothetical protein
MVVARKHRTREALGNRGLRCVRFMSTVPLPVKVLELGGMRYRWANTETCHGEQHPNPD